MDAKTVGPSLRLDERDAHAASLTLAATRLMRSGQARSAFELADRRCRLDLPPSPADRTIRALAGRLCGWSFWQRDLETALRADPLDPVVNATLLRLGTPEERRAAAVRLVDTPDAPPHALEDAISLLFESGVPAIFRLDLVDDRLSGWVAWRADGPARLDVEGMTGLYTLDLAGRVEDLPFLPPGAKAALVEARLPFDVARRVVLQIDGTVLAAAPPPSGRSRRSDRPATSTAPAAVPVRAPLAIVVPVYGDRDATAACLAAAVAEVERRPGTRLIVIDDASPDSLLTRHLRSLVDAGAIEWKRNDLNLGFAGAVRRGLLEAGPADVLLLNADAVLPTGALDRLADAAYSAPDIGTVTPLSNNGEYTSFPLPGIANPMPAPEAAAEIDAIAARLALPPVDLPTGTGFCLYLRHDARAAVGDLPGIYGRGYFEDMEFCLRARAAGFRSVAAVSVFVGHQGSRSFGEQKASLVSRNLRILRERFPATRKDCAAFSAADALRPARMAIEANLASDEALPLLVARATCPLLRTRLAHHGGMARQLLWSDWEGEPILRILGPNGAAPQSLRFALRDAEPSLAAYLAGLPAAPMEWLGSQAPPDGLVAALGSTRGPIDLIFGDVRPSAAPGRSSLLGSIALASTPLADRLRQAVALETQSLSVLEAEPSLPAGMVLVDARPARSTGSLPSRPSHAPPSIGLLCPHPSSGSDAFARALSAVLHARASPARVVVLGQALDALGLMGRGNVFVTGPLPVEEEAEILRLLGIEAIVLAPASSCLAEAERVAVSHALPLAVADWTFGQLSPASSSLFLDPHARDAANALATADWFAHRLEAAAA
ncbi:hypothetical protein ASG43_08635 [Aureimonas sp. Leaf454]|uniref:glycosyltransferase n=1 Tax=Aureimonas sp. Leaf454 TaxID=1736381 RepID=UPI0006F583AE|nr:glycosyltransferase [Aureimonas sp. Leaf454]KQT48897.1 hypothetical protein ASG43_08635 [Aureimonas sp. Leaf454]